MCLINRKSSPLFLNLKLNTSSSFSLQQQCQIPSILPILSLPARHPTLPVHRYPRTRLRILHFNLRTYPNLTRMAITIFTIPPMSAGPERVFSGAKHTIAPERIRLESKMVEMTECLKSWVATSSRRQQVPLGGVFRIIILLKRSNICRNLVRL